MSEHLVSVEQDNWCELITAVRAGLCQRALLMPAMTVEEVGIFVEACHEALFVEMDAMTFDRRVELELARASAD